MGERGERDEERERGRGTVRDGERQGAQAKIMDPGQRWRGMVKNVEVWSDIGGHCHESGDTERDGEMGAVRNEEVLAESTEGGTE